MIIKKNWFLIKSNTKIKSTNTKFLLEYFWITEPASWSSEKPKPKTTENSYAHQS